MSTGLATFHSHYQGNVTQYSIVMRFEVAYSANRADLYPLSLRSQVNWGEYKSI